MTLSQDIESRIAILDVVNRYVQTKKAGVNYKALCPFHQEKTPSFVISPAKNIAKCFSCGKWGGPIRFLMEIEHIEYREAVGILAKEAGIELRTQFHTKEQEKGKDIYAVYRLATEWYHHHLFSPDGTKALQYLLDRGMTEVTIRAFQLWYSSAPRDLLYFLKQQGFEKEFLIECGLFVSESRDKFFWRVIFPIANAMGHTVAFTGRILGTGEPKYLNSPASRIFDKSSILYGLHLAKQSIMKTGSVYIVEWQMDTVALHQAGIQNAVGISGTALTQEHVRMLKRFTRTVYLMLDADDAGIRATFASLENLLNSDIEIRIVQIPDGKDPDEFLKGWGDIAAITRESLGIIDYYILMGGRQYDMQTMVWKKQLIEKCLSFIARITSPIEADFYIKHLSEVFSVRRDALHESLQQIKKRLHHANESSAESMDTPAFRPTIADQIAAYIDKFSLLDLFFANFRYTIDELSQLPWTGLLLRILQWNSLEDDEQELLRTLDLYIDETQHEQHPDVIHRHFLDLVKNLHVHLLEQEKIAIFSGIDPASSAYLEAYTGLIQKAHTLGIPPGTLGKIL